MELTKDHFDKELGKMAVMIKTGFDATDVRFDQIDERFNKLETKVDVIQGKLDNILYKEVVHIESRVKKIEQHLGLKPA